MPRRFRVGVSDALPKITTYRLLEPALVLQPAFRLHVRIDKTERLLGELAIHAPDLVIADAPMLLQTTNTAVRQSLDQWFDVHGIEPRVVGEVEDMAMLQTLGEHGLGLFAAPTVVAAEVCRRYRVIRVGEIEKVREKFFAISVERRITHPAVRVIADQAKRRLCH